MLQIAGLGIGIMCNGKLTWFEPDRLVMDAVQLGGNFLGRGFHKHMNHQRPIL